jgi:hypothetical protein
LKKNYPWNSAQTGWRKKAVSRVVLFEKIFSLF